MMTSPDDKEPEERDRQEQKNEAVGVEEYLLLFGESGAGAGIVR